jgi:bacteriocin-like protein
MERDYQKIEAIELTDEELEAVNGGLNFFMAIFIPGTSSAPGGTGTNNGPTGTNGQGWVITKT